MTDYEFEVMQRNSVRNQLDELAKSYVNGDISNDQFLRERKQLVRAIGQDE